MNFKLYQKYLKQYVGEALIKSVGTAKGIEQYLESIQIKGLFPRDKVERQRALADAGKAFRDHRHWPIEIILSHLGIEPNNQGK